MTDLVPNSDGIEKLLRSSMSAPIPTLPSEFDQRVMRAFRRDSPKLLHYHHMLLSVYGIVSAIVCAALMRGQGLGWNTIGGFVLAPLALVVVARATWSIAKKMNSVAAN